MTCDDWSKPVPDDFKMLFEGLHQDVCILHLEWSLYRELFGVNKERVDLLNQVAPTLASTLQSVLQDAVYLGCTRLTEKAQTAGKANLTLWRLLDHFGAVVASSAAEKLSDLVQIATRSYMSFRAHRHKRIAHNDLLESLNDRFTRPGRQQIEDSLGSIRTVMHFVEESFGGTKCQYQSVIYSGGGNAMVMCLRDGILMSRIRRQVLSGEVTFEDLVAKIRPFPVDDSPEIN